MTACYCGSGNPFGNCCEPFINGIKKPETAEQLMRSRYSAYAVANADYLWATTALSQRKNYSKAGTLDWAKANQWLKLEVLFANENTVEFKAYYLTNQLQTVVHHERSRFVRENGNWFYADGQFFDTV